ncbi:hypothetical protein D9M73_193260 [compost metagenome]
MLVVEVAQIGLQAVATTQLGVERQAKIMLSVNILQLPIKVAGRKFRTEDVGRAGKVQPIAGVTRPARFGEQVHLFSVGGFTAADLGESPASQGQVVYLVGLDQYAMEGRHQLP